MRSGIHHPAAYMIAEFGCCQVDHGIEALFVDETFESPAAGPGLVENVAFDGGVIGGEVGEDVGYCWGCDAEH